MFDGVGKVDEHVIYIPQEVFEWLNLYADIDFEDLGTYYQLKTYELGNYVNAMLVNRNMLKNKRDSFEEGSAEYLEYETLQNKLKVKMNSVYGQMCKKEYITEKYYNGERFLTFDKDKEALNYPTMLTAAYIT